MGSYSTMKTVEDAGELLRKLSRRFNPEQQGQDKETENTVRAILHNVRERGLEAVIEYTRRFDAPEFSAGQFVVPEDALAQAAGAIAQEDREVILEAAENIREYHKHQQQNSWFTTRADGSVLGQMVTPVDRAGLYIPGGRGGMTPLLSSLLMNVIPAQVAGVPELALISPPLHDGTVNRHLLAAAHLLGVKEVYAAGSAWAIAALAYGAGSLRPVDIIAGPGNIFVATAKRLLIGQVGIDMIAGPSEILVIADETARPEWVAADMLSQAEHDTLASSICITTSRDVASATAEEMKKQCEQLPRKEVARTSLEDFGAIIYTPEIGTALDIANRIAPEHLELLVENPWELLPKIRHAGAVFMGHYASEPVGDYFAGPNHVLPTVRTARFSSALGVDTFMKKTSVVATSRQFAERHAESIARLARLEGLEAHARSALCRKK